MNSVLDLFEIDKILVNSSKISFGDSKLNPSFYSSNQYFINSLETKPLKELCLDIFNPPVFKREFVSDSDECRYLASGEITSLEPEITYITKDQAEELNLKVKRNWILVTGFGTIGNIRIVDESIKNFAVANNVARIISKNENIGFIAAFLSSGFGNKLLNDYAAGAVVKYIEAPQISQLPIPVLSEEVVSKTNELYLNAVSCRETAHQKLTQARHLVLEYNNLPPLDEVQPETLDPDKETDLRLVSTEEFTSDYRLDAHFYNPMAELAVRNIRKLASDFDSLSNVSNKVFYLNRFKRTFVNEKHGIPYLAGKDIIKIRPNDISYLSESETSNLGDYRLEKEWILLTCSGTIGRTCYIWKNYEDWVGTHDLIRIVSSEKMDSGYLFAFLSCDYGYHQILRHKHGAVIDHITPEQIEEILVPIPEKEKMKEIGELVRQAYDLRAEAIRLEDEAQEILTESLTGK